MNKTLKLIETGALMILAVFAPIQSLIITTVVLIVVDLVTGIYAAVKRSEAITSAGLRRTISKLFIYEVALMCAYLAEHYMQLDLPIVKMASTMVSLVELKSIMENLNSISGVDLLKSLIEKLGSSNAQ